MTTATKGTKGLKIDGFGYVVDRGTACNGGPGESPWVELEVAGVVWKWFAEFEDVLELNRGESVYVEAFGYEDASRGRRLRRVRVTRMNDDGSITVYGRKG